MLARVLLPALLWVSLAALLLLLPLRVQQVHGLIMLHLVRCVFATFMLHQVVGECKNCVLLGKEEKAMFRAHSEACMSQSQVSPTALASLLSGQPQLQDEPGLRKHVYCVLLKCKLIGKDGKLQKAALLGKLTTRHDARNATKVLESCAEQHGDTPEELAWNLFRCGYDKKAILFDYMPTGGDYMPAADAD